MTLGAFALFALQAVAETVTQPLSPQASSGPTLPIWVNTVGAARKPSSQETFEANSYGAIGDGKTPATKAIQKAIDACSSAGGGFVTFGKGKYLTGAIFVKSHVHLRIDEGVTLLGTLDESAYPILPTRVAGIEMSWPAALINVNGQEDVEISAL